MTDSFTAASPGCSCVNRSVSHMVRRLTRSNIVATDLVHLLIQLEPVPPSANLSQLPHSAQQRSTRPNSRLADQPLSDQGFSEPVLCLLVLLLNRERLPGQVLGPGPLVQAEVAPAQSREGQAKDERGGSDAVAASGVGLHSRVEVSQGELKGTESTHQHVPNVSDDFESGLGSRCGAKLGGVVPLWPRRRRSALE